MAFLQAEKRLWKDWRSDSIASLIDHKVGSRTKKQAFKPKLVGIGMLFVNVDDRPEILTYFKIPTHFNIRT